MIACSESSAGRTIVTLNAPICRVSSSRSSLGLVTGWQAVGIARRAARRSARAVRRASAGSMPWLKRPLASCIASTRSSDSGSGAVPPNWSVGSAAGTGGAAGGGAAAAASSRSLQAVDVVLQPLDRLLDRGDARGLGVEVALHPGEHRLRPAVARPAQQPADQREGDRREDEARADDEGAQEAWRLHRRLKTLPAEAQHAPPRRCPARRGRGRPRAATRRRPRAPAPRRAPRRSPARGRSGSARRSRAAARRPPRTVISTNSGLDLLADADGAGHHVRLRMARPPRPR